jgi:predicted dehydrogenase
MKKYKCAVIGVGYLGRFHAEKYASIDGAELVAICDTDEKRCIEIADKLEVPAVFNYRELKGKVDAVSIVTPTVTHYDIAKFFLENNVHILLEKPITKTVAEAESLISLARKNKLILQVGHLERFNNVLKEVGHLIKEPRFIESHRLAMYNPRGTDVNVMLDLMIHDIDIIQCLVKSPIKKIHANGASILTDKTDIVNARIEFENFCVANVTASRVSLRNERRMRIFQHDAYITFDLDKKHVSLHYKGDEEMFPGVQEIISKEQTFEKGDALKDEIASFIDSIRHNKPPLVTGEDGKNALATAIKITHLVNSQFDPEKTYFENV